MSKDHLPNIFKYHSCKDHFYLILKRLGNNIKGKITEYKINLNTTSLSLTQSVETQVWHGIRVPLKHSGPL